MNLLSVRLITADIQPLVQFYEQVTGQPATQYTPDFAELLTPTATLAIGSTRTLQAFGGAHVASAAANRSAIIEFRVADVDAEYQRLADRRRCSAAAHYHALGQPLVAIPRPRWQPRQLLHAGEFGGAEEVCQPVA
jgi:catechol 2,3-dioxygenase-like lactoylglutathione lyase family enzyme